MWNLFGKWPAVSRRNIKQARELSYGSPWVDRVSHIMDQPDTYDYVAPCGKDVYDVEKEGLYEPAVGSDKVYAVTILDGSGSQVVYTDDNPIIHVREV